MPIGDLITGVDQAQFNGLLVGAGTVHYELVSLARMPAVRPYKTDVPGGGSYTPRVEAAEMGLTLTLEVWAADATGLDTAWNAVEAAYGVVPGAPVSDQAFAWRLNGQAAVHYVMAHVEKPPVMTHDEAADVGFFRPAVIGLVASDPTVHIL